MEKIIQLWKSESNTKYDENVTFLRTLRSDKSWDIKSSKIHTAIFDKTDCLQCANCCKTTPALVLKSDAKRIAKHLGIPPKTFIKRYLIEDLNGELLLKSVPCTFLNEDNTCDIYDVRPRACRQYPHTDQEGFHKRSNMNAKNTLVCPAVFKIVEQLKLIDK
ncbi:MAG: YkgJ family cysteine cluster protein [Saprospiraceae bacterium]